MRSNTFEQIAFGQRKLEISKLQLDLRSIFNALKHLRARWNFPGHEGLTERRLRYYILKRSTFG